MFTVARLCLRAEAWFVPTRGPPVKEEPGVARV